MCVLGGSGGGGISMYKEDCIFKQTGQGRPIQMMTFRKRPEGESYESIQEK